MGINSLLAFDRGRPLFLPAHGRGKALPHELKQLLKNRAGVWDLPELPGLGGPLLSEGAVAVSQETEAVGIGAKKGWYGINGATGLLQAGLLSMVRPGQAVLMPRNVHRSLIHACAISDLRPVLFDLPFMADRGHFGPPDETWFKTVLDEVLFTDIKIAAVVLVHPTYHGYASDLAPLVKICHGQGWPVLVDEAHGAHFASGIDIGLPCSGLSVGADLIVHSLHKSGTGLVQTAVLWLQGDFLDPLAVERSVGWMQTSSPSALLLASCEAALRELRIPSRQRKWITRIDEARQIFSRLRDLGLPLLANQDPLKLILHTAVAGISGFEADDWFIDRGLIAELPEPGCLTFCLGFADQKGLIRSLKRRWGTLLEEYSHKKPIKSFLAPPLPLLTELTMPCGKAWRSISQSIPLKDSVGMISAELICPYPPGIPMLIPGEVLNQSLVEWLMKQRVLWPNQIPHKIRVISN